MSSLLLLGGTGFFGKSILDSFHRGLLSPWGISRIIALSRNPDRIRQDIPELITSSVELLSGDIGSMEQLPQADYVIHAAASTDAAKYQQQPESERENILNAVSNFCRLAPRYLSNAKIVYASSGAVYGAQPHDIGKVPENFPFRSLDSVPKNKQVYTLAKRECEQRIMALGLNNQINVSIARCYAFVGSWLPRDQHFAIGNFIEDGLNNRPIIVKARHPVYRSYLYADDLVEWLMTIAEHANPDCPIYNVGSDEAILMPELAGVVSHEFGVEVRAEAMTESIVDRYVPSIDKAREELSLEVRYQLQSAIRSTIREIFKQRN